jgi:hypothetical protein
MLAYQLDVGSLTTVTCGVEGCGIAFAIPSEMASSRMEDGGLFYCPNGHRVGWTETEVKKLRREVERKQKELEWAQQATIRAQAQTTLAENSRRAWKSQVTKTRKRIARGCCPECDATFPDLAKHMSAAHAKRKRAPAPPLPPKAP